MKCLLSTAHAAAASPKSTAPAAGEAASLEVAAALSTGHRLTAGGAARAIRTRALGGAIAAESGAAAFLKVPGTLPSWRLRKRRRTRGGTIAAASCADVAGAGARRRITDSL
jgi:hypothetical protein